MPKASNIAGEPEKKPDITFTEEQQAANTKETMRRLRQQSIADKEVAKKRRKKKT